MNPNVQNSSIIPNKEKCEKKLLPSLATWILAISSMIIVEIGLNVPAYVSPVILIPLLLQLLYPRFPGETVTLYMIGILSLIMLGVIARP